MNSHLIAQSEHDFPCQGSLDTKNQYFDAKKTKKDEINARAKSWLFWLVAKAVMQLLRSFELNGTLLSCC